VIGTQGGVAAAAGNAASAGRAGAAGGAASDGAVTGGTTAAGGTSSTPACTDEGCACTGTGTVACNDCGTRTCIAASQRWGSCSAPQNPAATQCANATTLQTCGTDGKWVSTTCTTTDATNCSASCVKDGTASSCKVSAKDADGDGHGNKLCSAAPGDDCDDANKNVYPGAVEVCDGVDNDCNGKADLKDGWSLSGTSLAEPYPIQGLAWSPSIQKFAAVTGGENTVYFGTLARTLGTAHATTWNSTPIVTQYYVNAAVTWVSARGTLVLAYGLNGRGVSGISAYEMDGQGVISQGASMADGGGSPPIASLSTGDVLILGNGYVNRYNGSTLVSPIPFSESYSWAKIAASGDQAAVIYQPTNESKIVKWFRITASLDAGLPSQLTAAGTYPDIASVPNGYGVAWRTDSGFDYQVMSASTGAVVCGPNHVSTASVAELVIASTQYGTLVLTAAQAGGQVHLFRIDDSCKVVDDLLVDSSGNDASDYAPVIAVGGGYVALAWPASDNSSSSKTRIIGEHLCD
jgi:hypothetical protein